MAVFELLVGKHVEGKDGNGNQMMYFPGDRFESMSNLLLLNPADPRMEKKFALVSGSVDEYEKRSPNQIGSGIVRAVPIEETDTTDDQKELEGMTVNQLRSYAEDLELDLGSATTKAQIVKVIQESLAAV